MPSEMVSFNTYRPSYHFIAPHSWMNDPCGAVYIPEIKEYILCYQWHPGSVDGGNTAWGMARSKDLITWTDCLPALRNGAPGSYDSHGVFSGSIVSRLVDRQRVLYLFYTSISAVPIHWSKPYAPGCETQSLACSTDFGHSWHRSQHNPLLTSPPHAAATTGWRDPFVSTWPSLSALRGVSPATNYMLTASGHRDRGPELILHSSPDLLIWTPLGPLLSAPFDSPLTPHPSSPLRHGKNFECASFFTLDGRDYLLTGIEAHPSQTPRHASRFAVWLAGTLVLDPVTRLPTFVPSAHGPLDAGLFYAPHLFRGPRAELLLAGWADEDLTPAADAEVKRAQGWAGCLALPRELFTLSRPISPDDDASAVADAHLWTPDPAAGTATTLGVRPARQLRGLRSGSMVYSHEPLRHLRSSSYELEARARRLTGSETLTICVRQAPGDAEVTRVVFDLAAASVVVDRSASSLAGYGERREERGTFRLAPGEDLHVRVFVDGSVVEVFANGRFACVTRVYPTLEEAVGVACEMEGGMEGAGGAEVSVQAWEGLGGGWPERGREVGVLGGRLGGLEIEDGEGEEEGKWEEEEEYEYEEYEVGEERGESKVPRAEAREMGRMAMAA